MRVLTDLLIIVLLITGAGFGGYFWGTHQQLAPVLKVALGTPGALPPPLIAPVSATTAATGDKKPAAAPATQSEAATAADSKPAALGKAKYWITSSGSDYIGYSITVKVNGTPIDSFFGPGKIVDVTALVKPGDNTLECEAKQMGEQYNKHTGEAQYKLTLQLVSGEHISDSYPKSAILRTYERSAADTDDKTDTLHFTGD